MATQWYQRLLMMITGKNSISPSPCKVNGTKWGGSGGSWSSAGKRKQARMATDGLSYHTLFPLSFPPFYSFPSFLVLEDGTRSERKRERDNRQVMISIYTYSSQSDEVKSLSLSFPSVQESKHLTGYQKATCARFTLSSPLPGRGVGYTQTHTHTLERDLPLAEKYTHRRLPSEQNSDQGQC